MSRTQKMNGNSYCLAQNDSIKRQSLNSYDNETYFYPLLINLCTNE